MEIIQEQSYEINNLISRTGKFTLPEFQKTLIEMVNTYKDFSIANGDYVITTTKAVEMKEGVQVMDVEILMPVNYRMPVDAPYMFKSTLRLTNALYSKVTEVAMLQDNINQINQYIQDQKLIPITSMYLVQTKQNNQLCIEIYVGINPNIL